MFVYAVKCESNMVVTTIQTNWCRYENRKTILFLSSVGISQHFFSSFYFSFKNMFAMKLHTLHGHYTLCVRVFGFLLILQDTPYFPYAYFMAAAFLVYSMNETRVTALIYIMQREMSYSEFNEILLCRDYLLSVFLFSDPSSSFTHMIGLENLNLLWVARFLVIYSRIRSGCHYFYSNIV